jgi:hypothetical protein
MCGITASNVALLKPGAIPGFRTTEWWKRTDFVQVKSDEFRRLPDLEVQEIERAGLQPQSRGVGFGCGVYLSK